MFEPRCPKCGAKGTPTYYAFPFPQWRCVSCINRSKQLKKIEKRIKKLEELEKE